MDNIRRGLKLVHSMRARKVSTRRSLRQIVDYERRTRQ